MYRFEYGDLENFLLYLVNTYMCFNLHVQFLTVTLQKREWMPYVCKESLQNDMIIG